MTNDHYPFHISFCQLHAYRNKNRIKTAFAGDLYLPGLQKNKIESESDLETSWSRRGDVTLYTRHALKLWENCTSLSFCDEGFDTR